MKVLDFHVHVGRKHHFTSWLISAMEDRIGPHALKFLDGLTPKGLIDYLNREGVEAAVVLAEATPKTSGVIPNEFTVEFCRGSDRLIPFGSILFESEVLPATQTEDLIRLGCRGLKLLPSYSHFYPDNPRMMPAYEVARDAGIPVMFHTGTSLFPDTRIRYAHPLLLDDVAAQFPTLTIVMSHGGRPFWYAEAEWLLRRHKNTYIDVAGIPPKHLPRVFPKLDKLADRFLFGTDWPLVKSIAAQIQQIRKLPLRDETIKAMFWNNAARLLKLDPLVSDQLPVARAS
ncbi:MAG: amidohydrolase [Desulfomonile tiedjei]|nr:amidohydrolase [Desulfomonile tiedjei]